MVEKSKMVNLTLPWPPSVNRYWRRRGNRYFVSTEGQKFRHNVEVICSDFSHKFDEKDRLSIEIAAYPPDKRRRDLDNVLKALLDSLQHVGIYHDDNQIDEIHIIRQSTLLGQVSIQLTKTEGRNLQMPLHDSVLV